MGKGSEWHVGSLDGYTLLLTTPNHTISAALNAKPPIDAEKDLVPVSVVAEVSTLELAERLKRDGWHYPESRA